MYTNIAIVYYIDLNKKNYENEATSTLRCDKTVD